MSRHTEGSSVVRVFMMTPEAETPERALFRAVIQDANDLKARVMGRQLKIVGGEESVWSRLRPHALLKKEVAAADLVIAAVGRDWDAVGDAASRFEADFDLARAHDAEIWLYVRDLDDALLAAPDASLRRVLDFRDRVEADGGVRYTRYADEVTWKGILLNDLFLWLDGLPLDPASGPVSAEDLETRLDAFAATPGALPESAHARLREAWSYAEVGRLSRAEEHFACAAADLPAPAVQIEYARFLREIGALEKSEARYARVLIGDPSAGLQSRVAAAYGGLGHAHEKRGELDEAKRLYRQSLHLNERLDDKEAMAADYGSLGNVYWMRSELEKAEQAYREALALNEALDRPDGMATDCGNLGNVYGVWGRLDEAEQMYRRSLEINERLGRRVSMANQYGNLGIVYRVQGRLDAAEDVYRKALAINEALGRQEGMAEDYNNLGNVCQERGRLDDAEAMYRQALAIDEALGRQEGMANQYGNLGVIYQTRGDLDRAEQMYRKSLAIFERLGDFVPTEQVRAWISDLEAQRQG